MKANWRIEVELLPRSSSCLLRQFEQNKIFKKVSLIKIYKTGDTLSERTSGSAVIIGNNADVQIMPSSSFNQTEQKNDSKTMT